MPFKGYEKYYTPFNSKDKTGNVVSVSDTRHILAVMDIVDKELPHINTIIMEDFQYVSGFEFMARVKEKGFDKFNDIANNIYLLAQKKPKEMRKDLIIFFLNHEENVMDDAVITKIKAKTCGKLIDNLITFEGLFTTVLRANKRKKDNKIEYFFETQTDGLSTAGTPRGMFEQAEIPNDLGFVRECMLSYNK
jgi:hypothetical protein